MPDPRVQITLPHRVRFTHGVFTPDNPTLRSVFDGTDADAKLLVVADQGLVESHPSLQRDIEGYFQHHVDALPHLVGFRGLPGGERVKNDLSLLEGLLGDLHRLDIDRRSYVLAIGGGALLDAAGFAAAVVHRGVRLVRMPTTTLAQADSGVGVKNGVNMFGQKNFIGTFAVPHAVVNDGSLLETLSDRDWRAGLAEAVKVALLKDAEFYRSIRDGADPLARRDAALGERVWRRSAELHLQHITGSVDSDSGGGGDPFELEQARPLDFGHWAAHKLEALSGYALRHGEAVAIGLALDATHAERTGLLDRAIADDIRRTLTALGFTLSHPAVGDPALLDGLDEFRQHLGGRLTVTTIRGVGDPIDLHEIDVDVMRACAAEFVGGSDASILAPAVSS
ncbi:MAG: 3-dehydroquinate synthase [Planctomycetota bacterium]